MILQDTTKLMHFRLFQFKHFRYFQHFQYFDTITFFYDPTEGPDILLKDL